MELDPTTTAVLALHWQNDIVSPRGRFAPTFSADAERTGVVQRCAGLLDFAEFLRSGVRQRIHSILERKRAARNSAGFGSDGGILWIQGHAPAAHT